MKSSRSVRQYQRVYIDASELGYYTCNPQLLQLVDKRFHLSKVQLLLFWFILSKYDSTVDRESGERQPVSATFEELAEYASCTKPGAVKAMEHLTLESVNLIKRVNRPKGKAKSEYCPNVELLHKLLEPLLRGHSV